MASQINASNSGFGGIVSTGDSSGVLQLQTVGTTAITVDTSQNTTLAGKLTTASSGIQFSDASTQTAAASPYVLKNRIINGDMRIDQRNAGASVTINTAAYTFTMDRWGAYGQATDGVYTVQRSTTAPTGFVNSLLATVTTADASIGASQFYILRHPIEGYNIADLNWGTANAATVTLSFWVRSSLTGTFSGSLTNGGYTRSYPFSYTISVANTWEQKSITIAGDTTGTWTTDNTAGINVYIDLGSGSSNKGTAGAWTGSGLVGVTGSVNLIGTNGATFYITGVQLEIGTSATPFERRLYGQELINCQRYCLKYCGNTLFEDVNCNLIGFNGTTAYGTIFTVVPMRSSPSVTSGTLRLTDQANVPTVTSVVASGASYSGPYNINVGVNVASGVVQFRPYQLQANNSTSAFLILSAEL